MAPFSLTPPVLPLERRTRGYDWLLTATALALALIGALLVWAATRDLQLAQHANPQAFLFRHLFNLAVAAVLMFLASRLDARLLRLFGPLVYVVSLLGLLLVLAVGSTVYGAQAWIRVGGGFELQPSEFTKLGLIIGMAVLFTQRAANRDDERPPTTGDVLLAIVMIAVPLVLATHGAGAYAADAVLTRSK
jgi:rod shape determining protein RodA